MNQEIQIEARTVYGHVNYYVVSEHAAAVRSLTGKLTVDLKDVRALESLGMRCVIAGRSQMPAVEVML